MMLPGLMSRWSTPRLWAYSIALQTSVKRAEELAKLQRAPARVGAHRRVAMKTIDRLFEAIAANEPHGIEGPSVAVRAEAVYRHDHPGARARR